MISMGIVTKQKLSTKFLTPHFENFLFSCLPVYQEPLDRKSFSGILCRDKKTGLALRVLVYRDQMREGHKYQIDEFKVEKYLAGLDEWQPERPNGLVKEIEGLRFRFEFVLGTEMVETHLRKWVENGTKNFFEIFPKRQS